MLFKRMAVAAFTLTTAFTFTLAAQTAEAPKAEAKAPRLTLVDPLKDFGTVPKGTKLDWSFTVKNTGDADLMILSANPTCGCTVAEFDKVIKPGSTGKVSAHVDTTAFSGPIQKAVNLATNDPNTPSAQLTINAVVKPYVEAYPAGFVRFNLMQGDAATQVVRLYSEEEQPFEITKIDVPGEHVKVNYKKIENPADRVEAGRPGQNQYAIEVTMGGPNVKVGPLAEKLIIHTNSKFQPEYAVSLTGVVRPTYTVTPTVLNFGDVTIGSDAATRVITLRSNNRNEAAAFKVEKAETPSADVTTEVKATTVPGEYEVIVKLKDKAKTGALDTSVKIYTNDKANAVTTLPVRGTIKPAA